MVRNARTAGRVGPVVMVRDARPDELDGIGDLRVAAYRADGFLPATSGYAATLRSLGADGQGEVLAAVDGGQVVGTVTLQGWPAGQMARGPGEAEVRALAVAPGARGRGSRRRAGRRGDRAGGRAGDPTAGAADPAGHACRPPPVQPGRIQAAARP